MRSTAFCALIFILHTKALSKHGLRLACFAVSLYSREVGRIAITFLSVHLSPLSIHPKIQRPTTCPQNLQCHSQLKDLQFPSPADLSYEFIAQEFNAANLVVFKNCSHTTRSVVFAKPALYLNEESSGINSHVRRSDLPGSNPTHI